MKKIYIFILFFIPLWAMAQKSIVIEGPNDQVAPVTLQVKSDFDQEKGILRLTITGDDTAECNALWLLQEPTPFGKLDGYFKQHDGKLSVSSFAKEQMKFMNLTEKTADPVFQITGAQMPDKMSIQSKEGVKAAIQKQILPLDNRSTLTMDLQVSPDTKTVTVSLRNPLMLLNKEGGKYELAFIGNKTSIDFDVTIDYCASHAEILTQLREYNKVFRKGEMILRQTESPCVDKVKSLLISEITQINLKRFEQSRCQDVENQLDSLNALIEHITNYHVSQAGDASGGGAGMGSGSASTVDDCNVKKVNDDLKAAVPKLNTYANDWISATDPAVKQAKKLAFDGLVKETEAKLNALTPVCRKKVDSGLLKNYEMAKKLINK